MWIDNITPAGPIDGMNVVFRLPQMPVPLESLWFTRNGQLLYLNVGITIANEVVTIIDPQHIPQIGDDLRASFRVVG